MSFLEKHGGRIGPALAIFLAALGQAWIGGGTFGPDAAGAQASAVLGGHPYPLHPLLIRVFGTASLLSILSAGVTVTCGIRIAIRLGASPLAAGLTLACAPLLLYPAFLGGGDAPAMAVFMAGLSTALGGHAFLGTLLAVCSLGIKPIIAPLLLLLVLVPALAPSPQKTAVHTLSAAVIGLVAFGFTLDPLLDPKPASGLLGSWWLASGGLPIAWTEAPTAGIQGILSLWGLPTWTGHPLLGLLALAGALVPGSNRRARLLVLLAGLIGVVTVASLLAEQLRPRYLGPASIPLALLASVTLTRAPLVALLGAWPALALASQLGGLRAIEEGLSPPPTVRFPGLEDVTLQYQDSSICGAEDLQSLAAQLADTAGPNQEVVALRLRDGREGNLLWPLKALRPDLKTTVFHSDCCPEGPVECANALLNHVRAGGILVSPLNTEGCKTEVLDPGEQAIAAALAREIQSDEIFAVVTGAAANQPGDACSAVRPPLPGESPR
ncbi:MAG: hypothetical protein VX519_08545 [Myxococcota bacterium]|nr:hypothetical protein [Myxococcota bacterium]